MTPADAGAEVVLLRDGAEVASWLLPCRDGVDISVVDDLARLHLDVRRRGYSLSLRHSCPDLARLLDLVGLGDVLQVGRKAEAGEEVGVEEVVVPDDLLA